MDAFKDELLNVPISFEQKSLEKQAQERNLIYQLSKQYTYTAHNIVTEIQTELDLRQYYTLINQAIRCLRYLKDGGLQMSLEQDFQVTVDLVSLLIEETHRTDLAEQYISGLRDKLHTTTWVNEKMYTDYILLCKIPLQKSDVNHRKIALRNLTKLISSLDTSLWKVLFQYFRLQLIPGSERKISDYKDILFVIKSHQQFRFIVMCSFINHCLDEGICIPDDIINDFHEMDTEVARLKIWKLLLELLLSIFTDVNITDKLTELKSFFDKNKEEMDTPLEPILLFENVSMKLDLPVFGYKDVKNLLLFFQSVSYLPNCYDKRSNFSVKFLPKTISTTEKLISSLNEKCSLSKLDSLHNFYRTLLDLVRFYQACESIMLLGTAEDITLKSPYDGILQAWNAQLKGQAEIASDIYHSILLDASQNREMKLLSLLHLYAITLAEISKCDIGSDNLHTLTTKANQLMSQLDSSLNSSIFGTSTVWRCTKLLLIIMGKFEPFTKNPQASNQTSVFITELEQYFAGNSLLPAENSTTDFEPIKIKKSLVLHTWLNYIAGSMLVNDLAEKCVLSSTCFKLTKQQYLPHLRYLVGIWNLMNNTVAMNSKEVALTKARLDQIVNDLELSSNAGKITSATTS
ncbi:unnamed protein product [Kluyveromyces dobzhanskii CBS 2104]|uniref:WGS project CCBQ000000000 data, contig 00014 n=1 Tax=Kluyveromyces dobzhanskii CBS 2104 TaxID=1427455 RepID=A0A0A8L949_9SACH|nr:unnamed protein product [Kluyveromyces dobzhanskii CBS 2104]